MTTRQELNNTYEAMCEIYGVNSRSWDEIHCHFSPYMFCKDNRKSLVAEYLMWEEFVEDAKKYDIPYYIGIDEFLEKYKDAVYNCLTNI